MLHCMVMEKNLAEKLGYSADAKLLVVNSDDTGAHPSFTKGVFEIMKYGMVKSTSIIVNDRNDAELIQIAALASEHPDWGFGIHLSLTNEYQEDFPWKPVLSKDIVPTLYNDKGLAWETTAEVAIKVDPAHAALEFEAQIKKGIKLGIDLTHIDSHMGTAYMDSEFPEAEVDGVRNAAVQAA